MDDGTLGDLLVGDDEVTYNMVIETMETSPVFGECYTNWRDLARKLDIDEDSKNKIARNILFDPSYGTSSIISDILIVWRSRKTDKATLAFLLKALEDIGLDDISRALRNKFIESQTNIVDNTDGTSSTIESSQPISEEGKKLRDYVRYYLVDLIDMTDVSDRLLEAIVDKDVLEIVDIDKINRSRYREDKVRSFYQILLDKIGKEPEIYDTVVTVFMNDDSNRKRGVADLFDRCSE